MMLRDGSFSRWAIVAGRMLVSRLSDRSYSASIASRARRVSRSEYPTTAIAIAKAEMTVRMKPDFNAQSGCTPVL